jgi:hypothetical protein
VNSPHKNDMPPECLDVLLYAIILLALPMNKRKDIVFRFIIEYSSSRDFGPLDNNRFIFFNMRIFGG